MASQAKESSFSGQTLPKCGVSLGPESADENQEANRGAGQEKRLRAVDSNKSCAGASARLVSLNDQGWSCALSVLPHDSYHLAGYVSLEASRMGGYAQGFIYEEADRLFVLPLVFRTIPGTDLLDACSPYGYPGPIAGPKVGTDFLRRACSSLRNVMHEAGIVSCFIRTHPLFPLDRIALEDVGVVVQHGHTVSIDLSLSDSENWSQVRANHRRQIQQGRRRGATVRIDDWGRVGEFIEMYNETMRRVNADAFYFFSADYFTSLREAVGGAAHLVLIDAPGTDTSIGGGIFLETGRLVQYHLGATRTEFLHYQPTKLMFEEVRSWAKHRGNVAFHLGGDAQRGDSSPLFHFKRGFSRDVRPFYTWRMIVDSAKYARLTNAGLRHADSDDVAGFFPAYRREG